jgi:hypothetical protein
MRFGKFVFSRVIDQGVMRANPLNSSGQWCVSLEKAHDELLKFSRWTENSHIKSLIECRCPALQFKLKSAFYDVVEKGVSFIQHLLSPSEPSLILR